jgi:hypothetical protein
MFIRMLFEITGTRNGQPWPKRGGLIDLPASEAKNLIAQGLAVHIDAPVELAEAAPATIEVAMIPTVRKARGKRS